MNNNNLSFDMALQSILKNPFKEKKLGKQFQFHIKVALDLPSLDHRYKIFYILNSTIIPESFFT